jgi:lipopolysaccharide/colanic/teichoic acid biosynthesis glycosyltransferase
VAVPQQASGRTKTLSYRVGKRSFDIALCLLMAPFVLPVCLLIALCSQIDSPGPVFYCHRRIGLYGKSFGMWKFRTMCKDADTVLHHYLEQHPELLQEWKTQHKLKNDPRVTRLGTFLRRTSLDELPQIWNVFKGSMSFVGPRPIVDAEVHKYGNHFQCFTEIRPGMTGLWQVSGRSTLSYEARIKLDVHYAREWSGMLDMKILLKTFSCVVNSDGAF